MKRILLLMLIALCFAQWWIPGEILWSRKKVLSKGQSFKFETQPIDPVNPFKGRYVSLNFAAETYRTNNPRDLKYGQTVYALLKTDTSGYAVISGLYTHQPASQTDYVKVSIDYLNNWDDSATTTIRLNFPFDEYYMEEFRAPKTEALYRDSAMRNKPAYALVKVFKGEAVTEGLFINDTSIEELIR